MSVLKYLSPKIVVVADGVELKRVCTKDVDAALLKAYDERDNSDITPGMMRARFSCTLPFVPGKIVGMCSGLPQRPKTYKNNSQEAWARFLYITKREETCTWYKVQSTESTTLFLPDIDIAQDLLDEFAKNPQILKNSETKIPVYRKRKADGSISTPRETPKKNIPKKVKVEKKNEDKEDLNADFDETSSDVVEEDSLDDSNSTLDDDDAQDTPKKKKKIGLKRKSSKKIIKDKVERIDGLTITWN